MRKYARAEAEIFKGSGLYGMVMWFVLGKQNVYQPKRCIVLPRLLSIAFLSRVTQPHEPLIVTQPLHNYQAAEPNNRKGRKISP